MDLNKTNRKRCIIALILCLTVFITANFALLVGVTTDGDYIYLGLENLRYFTYDSNIFVALCSFLCIPFQIDGLRNKNYHLPRWLVYLLYVSVCAVTVTLLLTIAFVLPYKGFYRTYLDKGNLFAHFLTPIMSIIMFIFINDDHELRKNALFYAFIPFIVYGSVYTIEVFVKKNWFDHYYLSGVIPTALAIFIVAFAYLLIAMLIRKLHNKSHKLAKEKIKDYYMNSSEVCIEDAIKNLAIKNKELDKGGDLVVPRRIILMMEDKYKSGKSIEELCCIYTNEYLRK